MKNETVQTRVPTSGQYKEILGTFIQAMPDLTFADAEIIIGAKTPFMNDIRAMFAKYTASSVVESAILDWQNFYLEEYGMECDFSQVRLPNGLKGFNRVIFVPRGISAQRVYDRLKELFGCWKYTEGSLDNAVPTNERDPKNGTYAILVRNRVEADQEHKNKSANIIKRDEVATETLLERLLHEHKYFLETGKHLDIENWTLCAGSRHSDGRVPSVSWDDGEVSVYWYNPDDSYDDLRAREVAS